MLYEYRSYFVMEQLLLLNFFTCHFFVFCFGANKTFILEGANEFEFLPLFFNYNPIFLGTVVTTDRVHHHDDPDWSRLLHYYYRTLLFLYSD